MMFLDEYNLKNDFLGFSLIFQPHVVIEFRVVTRLIKKTQERTMRCSLLRQKLKKKKIRCKPRLQDPNTRRLFY
jgi:hypothetical protein